MNSTELDARVRMGAFIGDPTTAPDYTTAWVLNELNDQMTLLFERAIVNARQGFWRKSYQFAIIAGDANYPVPPRAIAGGFDKIDIAFDSNLNFVPLREYSEDDVRLIEQGQPGPVSGFVMRGDQIILLPTPDNSAFWLRPSYYSRPSRLVGPQNNTSGTGGTDRGRITSIASIGSRQVIINTLPFDQELVTPAVITSGSQPIDIVRPNGWHEIQVIGATQTFTGTTPATVTIGGVDDLSTVQVGDYVRVAEQTDWPNLPDDYARCLADATAIKILTQLGDKQKAEVLSGILGSDLSRFLELLSPRVKNTGGQDIVAPFNLYRGSGIPWQVKYP